MICKTYLIAFDHQSPSTRREWIEINALTPTNARSLCLPPHGGSGLKSLPYRIALSRACLPPHGGSGLKSEAVWTEMCGVLSLPPHGGSGLKSLVSYCDNVEQSLPPHGGSGLKCPAMDAVGMSIRSPSTRREWIEISKCWNLKPLRHVSLHTEGVD